MSQHNLQCYTNVHSEPAERKLYLGSHVHSYSYLKQYKNAHRIRNSQTWHT